MMDKCKYCVLLMKHINVLKSELTKSKPAALCELKSYYWLTEEYCNEVLFNCECEYKQEFRNVLEELLELFRLNEIVIEAEKKQCDVCKILPFGPVSRFSTK